MKPDAIDAELSREPFVRLGLFLSNGRAVLIQNPGLCWINRGSLSIARTDRPHSRLADDVALISLRHIVSVEQVSDSNGSNGAGRHERPPLQASRPADPAQAAHALAVHT